MHYFIAVIVPADTTTESLDARVADLMSPYDEKDGDNPGGKWDWYSIGGRWTGVLADYDPTKDPRNHKPCWLCHGTGMRNDPIGQEHRRTNPDYTCNGCSDGPQPGVMVDHPSQWAKTEADLVPVSALLARTDDWQKPHGILTPDGWLECETWTGSGFVETTDWDQVARSAFEKHSDALVAVVDIHS